MPDLLARIKNSIKPSNNDLLDKIKELIQFQSLSNEEDRELFINIYKKVTRETHNYESPKKNGDGTITECIGLFKKGADPNVLSTLEKSLSEQIELEKSPEKKEEYQKHYKYYIKNFLPALKVEITNSKKLDQEKVKEIGRIISGIIKRSSNKDSKIEEQPINSIKKEIPVSSTGMTENNVESPTKEEVCASDSDSGVSSRKPSEESLESPISSRRSSVSSILSSAGENNDPQKEDTGNQMQPEQTAEEEPQVSSQCVTLGSREKESMDTNSQTTQMTGSQAKDSMQPEEKRDRKNAITIVQKFPLNKKKGEDTPLEKQPNNRNLYVALAAGCALLAVGCVAVAAKKESQIFYFMGAVLFVTAAMLAITTAVTWYLTPPSSELTSTNLSRPVDDKKLTACSQR